MRLVGLFSLRASYESSLAPADAIRQLACHGEPQRWNRAYRPFGWQDVPPLRCQGRIWDGGFKIQRIPWIRLLV